MPPTLTNNTPTVSAVTVHAPARLHLGFIDPSASLGRRFGSLGLCIEGPAIRLKLSRRDKNVASGDLVTLASPSQTAMIEEARRATAHLAALKHATGRHEALALHLDTIIPAHAGFGSGTQLALAVGRAFATLHGLDYSTPALATLLGRGLRSGVGIGSFDQGGLLLDGGPGAAGSPAPLLSRLHFPDDWRILLVMDESSQGLFGQNERAAIAALPPFPAEAAAAISHQLLMRILPCAACGEFGPFAQGVTEMQNLVGGHFAPAQNNSLFTSASVGRLMDWIGATTPAAIGQSSWGPTGFAILPDQASAEALVAEAHRQGMADDNLTLAIVPGRNRGADICSAPTAETPRAHPSLPVPTSV